MSTDLPVSGSRRLRPKIGFVAPPEAPAVHELEAIGVDSLWVGGHVSSRNPSPEPLVWLARLVEQSTLCQIGTATLVLPLYPPALLAKQVADLDRASVGRLRLGIGVGGEYDDDFRAVGVPRSERGSRADEAIGLLRQFWTAEPVTHSGRHWDFESLRIHPEPHQPGGPPILVSGRKEPAMRRAARYGDGWMPYLYSPDAYRRSRDSILDIAAADGRELDAFEWLAYVFVSVDPDPERARRRAVDSLERTYRQSFDSIVDRLVVAGDVDSVGRRLQEYLDAGAGHLVLCCLEDEMMRTPSLVMSEVAPFLSISD